MNALPLVCTAVESDGPKWNHAVIGGAAIGRIDGNLTARNLHTPSKESCVQNRFYDANIYDRGCIF
jgi:hypothetical protein